MATIIDDDTKNEIEDIKSTANVDALSDDEKIQADAKQTAKNEEVSSGSEGVMADSEKVEDGSMSLIEHLTELRNRISCHGWVCRDFLACFIKPFGRIAILRKSSICFYRHLLRKEKRCRMIFTALHEGFFTQVKVAFCLHIYYIPFMLLQIWRFVARLV